MQSSKRLPLVALFALIACALLLAACGSSEEKPPSAASLISKANDNLGAQKSVSISGKASYEATEKSKVDKVEGSFSIDSSLSTTSPQAKLVLSSGLLNVAEVVVKEDKVYVSSPSLKFPLLLPGEDQAAQAAEAQDFLSSDMTGQDEILQLAADATSVVEGNAIDGAETWAAQLDPSELDYRALLNTYASIYEANLRFESEQAGKDGMKPAEINKLVAEIKKEVAAISDKDLDQAREILSRVKAEALFSKDSGLLVGLNVDAEWTKAELNTVLGAAVKGGSPNDSAPENLVISFSWTADYSANDFSATPPAGAVSIETKRGSNELFNAIGLGGLGLGNPSLG